MVRKTPTVEELKELFEVKNGKLLGKEVSWRRKESNTRVSGKTLGTKTKSGHLEINFKSRCGTKHKMLVHRVIFYMSYGYLPEQIDHINRDPTDNRPENLRSCTKQLNALNVFPRVNNKTGKKGVHFYKGKYRASMYLEKRKVHLGSFETLEEACNAVDARRNEEVEQARARGYISPFESCKEKV